MKKLTFFLLAATLFTNINAHAQDKNFYVFLAFGQSNMEGAEKNDDLPKTIPTAHVISSAGCTALPDRLHFNAAGYEELGNRYAREMLALLNRPLADDKPLAATVK